MEVCARAHPNIALIKYWGKAAVAGNLPAVGSLSITLRELVTTTRVGAATGDQDQVIVNGVSTAGQSGRVSSFLNLLRQRARRRVCLRVDTHNNFPTAAGLASSASGFAALVLAASRFLGLNLSPAELADLARQGSGSACRSIFGGFVEWRGRSVTQLADVDHWPLETVVAVVSTASKSVGSTAAMEISRRTSAFYDPWIRAQEQDLQEARASVLSRDFDRLAQVSEHSCLKMHAVIMSSRPGILYWKPASLAAIQVIQGLRKEGHGVFFTMDAGPQVKAICLPPAADRVAAALAATPGVVQVMRSGLGAGACLEAAS